MPQASLGFSQSKMLNVCPQSPCLSAQEGVQSLFLVEENNQKHEMNVGGGLTTHWGEAALPVR